MRKRVKVGESHEIPKTWKMRRYLVGETVSEVMIVRDTVTESNGDVFLLDEAIELKTEESTITISKSCEVDTSLFKIEHLTIEERERSYSKGTSKNV